MARNTSSVAEEASTGLHCKTWLLRVSFHCQGCKRKVSKILLAIHGVYTVTVDMKQQRVTVTGNVEGETLITKLSNKGKKASICDSNEPKNPKGNQEQEKSSQKKNKENQKQKQSENRGTKQEEEPKAVVIPAAAENSSPKTQTVSKDSPGNRVSGEKKRHEGKSKAEKKEIKVQQDNNVDPNSASSSVPPCSSDPSGGDRYHYQQMATNQVLHSPYQYHPQQFYYFPAAVNATHPNPFFLHDQQQAYPFGNPDQLFSDENVNGCFVM